MLNRLHHAEAWTLTKKVPRGVLGVCWWVIGRRYMHSEQAQSSMKSVIWHMCLTKGINDKRRRASPVLVSGSREAYPGK